MTRRPPTPRAFVRVLGLVVVLLPFALAVSRAAGTGQWREDIAAVRDVGLVAVGAGGALSTVVTQALGLLPLGPKVFRAALGSALALAFTTHLLFAIGRRLLALAAPRARVLGPALAALAALTAGLSPTFQNEATVGGGAMLAVATATAALAIALRGASPLEGEALPRSARQLAALGALVGATTAESPPLGLGLLAALVALGLLGRGIVGAQTIVVPTRRPLILGAAVAVVVAALFFAPLALRPLAPRAWVDVGRALSMSSLGALDVAAERTTALAAWSREIGLVSLLIAAFGGVVAAVKKRLRPAMAALAVLVVADVLVPASVTGVLAADARAPLRACAVAALALLSALGVARAVDFCLGLVGKVPFARPAAVLLVAFHVTLVALASEEASFAADRSAQTGAEEWADEALGALEPRAAVLVSSPAVAWRLWAARITRGERPDVVVIPAPLLDRGRVAASLLATEPAMELLLRDFALTGAPSELGLSKLADVRPLHVELLGEWPKRLVAHLVVDGMWLEFAPQPLGPSDRKQATAATLAPHRRALLAVRRGEVPDAPTEAVLEATLRSQIAVLTQLGDHDAAKALGEGLAALTLGSSAGLAEGALASLPAIRSVAAPTPPAAATP